MTPAVSVSSLTKKYGEVEAVRGIDFEVAAGQRFGFLGPNAAGKSTTIKTLADPTSGSARVAGYDVTSGRDTVRRNVGLVSGTSPWATVLRAARFGWVVPLRLSVAIVDLMGTAMPAIAIAEFRKTE